MRARRGHSSYILGQGSIMICKLGNIVLTVQREVEASVQSHWFASQTWRTDKGDVFIHIWAVVLRAIDA